MASALTWVHPDTPLPPAEMARSNPPGLVAAGMDLGIARLTEAYRKGIFPWFSEGDPVLWWSPDPRMVLMTDELHISKSLGKKLRQIEHLQNNGQFDVIVTTDLAFAAVIHGCATRGHPIGAQLDGQPDSSTWITPDMKSAYWQWHQAGDVHSIETWVNGQLAGGLYGVCLGRMFFGESMFTRTSNASKIALVHLVRFLEHRGVTMIDCQMQTDHLASLGARSIDRAEFLSHIRQAVDEPGFVWPAGWIDSIGQCHQDLPSGVVLNLTDLSFFSYDESP
ncbi:leucyl/phenylalanyl-tRNA--protein transferase [Orrella daihaiensis]|uniref:Leucyl/phenylalanyl-tRNA--protein transferase n=1 Tax=Orrella daihaiensis TaxID=2782176 RepID=A0ABY4AM12_9BURK|nr:leucyl/phenylalanyl-tRNA--protein transferase [Orrella daihaiensis]UOD51351.1 leucyl/phenylalanyl-tRNA--protein transferase [Orrella daihaiensis]